MIIKKPGISPRLCPNPDSHFSGFNRMQLLIVCLQSGSGQVKQLGLYGQTPGAASWAGVTVLRPVRGILCGLWRVLAGALLGDMSG